MIPGLVERLRERRSNTQDKQAGLPPGFEDLYGDADDTPTE